MSEQTKEITTDSKTSAGVVILFLLLIISVLGTYGGTMLNELSDNNDKPLFSEVEKKKIIKTLSIMFLVMNLILLIIFLYYGLWGSIANLVLWNLIFVTVLSVVLFSLDKYGSYANNVAILKKENKNNFKKKYDLDRENMIYKQDVDKLTLQCNTCENTLKKWEESYQAIKGTKLMPTTSTVQEDVLNKYKDEVARLTAENKRCNADLDLFKLELSKVQTAPQMVPGVSKQVAEQTTLGVQTTPGGVKFLKERFKK